MFHKLRGQLTENTFESTDFHFYLILLSIIKLLIKAGPKLTKSYKTKVLQ